MKTNLTLISFFLLGNIIAQNLINNGNAEAGDLTGWAPDSNIIEASMQTAQTNGLVTPQEGSYFFSFANKPGEAAVLTQEGSIDTPLESLQLSGFFHGEFISGPGNDDFGEVILSIFDAMGDLQNSISTGELQPSNPESWEVFLLEIPLESNSASWKLELKGDRRVGTFTNVFYDDLVLLNSDILNTSENILEEVVIYPNPTSETVSISATELVKKMTVTIHNVFGQKLQQETLFNQLKWSTTLFGSKGVYFVTIKLDDQQIQTFKIIKQ